MQFTYRAKTQDGRTVNGVLDAANTTEAYKRLRQDKLFPIVIAPYQSPVSIPFLSFKLRSQDLVLFCQNMATLIQSGISLVESLQIVANQTRQKKFQQVLRDMIADISKGLSLTEAMRKQRIFPELVPALVAVGEETGNLQNSFRKLAAYYDRQGEIAGKIKGAMIYPVMVILVSIVVLYIMTTKVLPQILNMVQNAGVPLGLPTRILIGMSHFFQTYGFLFIAGVVGGSVFLVRMRQTVWKEQFDILSYRMPLFGNLLKQSMASQFASTLSTLVTAGVALPNALDIIKGLINNVRVRKNIDEVKGGVIRGEPINRHLSPELFDSMVINIIAVGERTGDMEEPLEMVAQYLDREVNMAVGRFTEMIMPIAIVFLGIMVGMIVLGVMGPMFAMYRRTGI